MWSQQRGNKIVQKTLLEQPTKTKPTNISLKNFCLINEMSVISKHYKSYSLNHRLCDILHINCCQRRKVRSVYETPAKWMFADEVVVRATIKWLALDLVENWIQRFLACMRLTSKMKIY